MRIQRFLLLPVLLATTGLACSDGGPIEPSDPGHVGGVVTTTLLDGHPLQFAVVAIEGKKYRTGPDGSYLIKNVTAGDRVVSATRWDHQDYAATVSVTANQLTTHDILLVPLDANVRFAVGVRGTTGTVEVGFEGDPSEQLPPEGFTEYRATKPGERVPVISDAAGTIRRGRVLLGPGKYQTSVHVGPNRDSAVGLLLTDEPGLPGEGRTLVRAVHGSIQTGPVDLYLLEAGKQPDGTPLIPGFDFLDIGDYEDLAAGEVSLVLTKESEPDSVRFDSGPLSAPSGSAWTLLVIEGASAPDAIDMIVLDDG